MANQTGSLITKTPVFSPALTIGFGTAAAMWAAGYLLRLPGEGAPGPLTAATLVLLQLAGGAVAGLLTPRATAWRVGLLAGLISSLINLLVIGSLITDHDTPNAIREGAAVWVVGWLVLGTGLAGAGAAMAARFLKGPPPPSTTGHWLARFAFVAAGSVLLLLGIGGIVTSTDAGMAVEDWPTSEGFNMFLYPLSRMTGGRLYEHAHRLFGALVGLTTLTLTLFTLFADSRRWVKGVLAAAFVLVCLQGVMGGLRVVHDDQFLRFAHGVTAQIFFGLMCAIAAMLSVRWKAGAPARPDAGASVTRKLAWTLVGVLLFQIALGAATRHFHRAGLPHLHVMIAHATFSVVALGMVLAVGMRAGKRHADEPILRRIGKSMSHAVGLQMALGVAAIWVVLTYRESDPPLEVAIATSHQVLGAALLGLSTWMAVWSTRLLRPTGPGASDHSGAPPLMS